MCTLLFGPTPPWTQCRPVFVKGSWSTWRLRPLAGEAEYEVLCLQINMPSMEVMRSEGWTAQMVAKTCWTPG